MMLHHPDVLLELSCQRQARVRAEIAMMRSREVGHQPGIVRRQLGAALIVLGQRLTGSASAGRALATPLPLSAVKHA
jgi:hypothetical protein